MLKFPLKARLVTSLAIAILMPFGTAMAAFNSMLAPTSYTPSGYIPPQYDAFDHNYYYPPQLPDRDPDTPPVADFNIFVRQLGFQNVSAGTTKTEFVFDASASTDAETDSGKLEVRWDFENDGHVDSYFSQAKSIRHTFKNPGNYSVKLEVLDRGGNTSGTTKRVTIVENTPPTAIFVYRPISGTEKTIFGFDAGRSYDDQSLSSSLDYRFDWDGDGKWDTKFQNKNLWYHRFDDVGSHRVVMQVRDPGGLTAQAEQQINTHANVPPMASFTITALNAKNGVTTMQFNASGSSDAETPHQRLRFRWDFSYHGRDDIIYNTYLAYTDRASANYDLPGRYIVKLEVVDEDGATDTSFAEVDIK